MSTTGKNEKEDVVRRSVGRLAQSFDSERWEIADGAIPWNRGCLLRGQNITNRTDGAILIDGFAEVAGLA